MLSNLVEEDEPPIIIHCRATTYTPSPPKQTQRPLIATIFFSKNPILPIFLHYPTIIKDIACLFRSNLYIEHHQISNQIKVSILINLAIPILSF